jgi:hypothetical protein
MNTYNKRGKNVINIKNYIDDMNLQMEEGYRGDCPMCNGRNTFTVTRKVDGTLYNCYKAGCSISGTSPTTVSVNDMLNRKEKSISAKFILPSHIIPGRAEAATWAESYGLDAIKNNLHYDVKENRIVFPVIHDHEIVDATGRALAIGQLPKWKRYGNSSYAYTSGIGEVAVVVEDCISAAVVSTGISNCVGMALLGTALLPNHIAQLKDYRGVVVALDPDAVKKTLQFTAELKGALYHTNIFALKLEDDLKYAKKYDMVDVNSAVLKLTQGEIDGTRTVTHSDQ